MSFVSLLVMLACLNGSIEHLGAAEVSVFVGTGASDTFVSFWEADHVDLLRCVPFGVCLVELCRVVFGIPVVDVLWVFVLDV